MLDQGQIQGYTRADIDYFFSRELADDLVANGSSGRWINPRANSQTVFFDPHLGIGHHWDWDNDVARQIFDMDSRLGSSLRHELGDQLVEPAIRQSIRLTGNAVGANGSRQQAPSRERSGALIDRAIQSGVAERPQSQAAQLPPLFEPLPNEPAPANLDAELPGSSILSETVGVPNTLENANLGGGDAADTLGLASQGRAGLPLFLRGAGMTGESDQGAGPEAPSTDVLYSPQGLISIREQRISIVEAIGVVNDYIRETQEAEAHNRLAGEAAGSLKEHNAEQGEFAQAERNTVAGEQDKLTQAGGAQENMAAENERASGEAERGQGEADTVQSEGESVSVEPKPEEPEERSWLERAWDATAGALWDNLIAPAVRAVKRKVKQVMQSINDFIMKMINQALGLDEIEAELNGGREDIDNRGTSLSETDTDLQETQDQAMQEQERNQQSIDQADSNIADSQTMREDAETLRSDLDAHNELLQAEEEAGAAYIVDFGSHYQPFFEAEGTAGDTTSEPSEGSLSAEGGEPDALAPADMQFEPEGANETVPV